jgi:hypothetical protein
MRRRSRDPFVTLVAALPLLAACAGDPPVARRKPRVAVVDAEPIVVQERRPVDAEGEIGGLDQHGYDDAFKRAWPEIAQCLEDGASRLDLLGGQFKIVMRIDRSGEPKWAYLSESTLGDRDTEKCVLDLVRARRWPKPLSGDGIAEKSFSLDPAVAPEELAADDLRKGVTKARSKARSCRRGIKGRFTATAYLDADGSVLTAGVAPPSEIGEDVADCVVDAVKSVRLGRALPSAGKVSFAL